MVKRLHRVVSLPGGALFLIFRRGDAKLLLEDHGEVALGAEPALVGNLCNGIFTALEQFGSAIELVGAEEVGGCLARQSLDLIVEFGARDIEHLGDACDVEFGV